MREPTPREMEYLSILQEECAEVIQIISKIRRFGINSFHPEDPNRLSNRERLVAELGDVKALVDLIKEADELNPLFNSVEVSYYSGLKRKKLDNFLQT